MQGPIVTERMVTRGPARGSSQEDHCPNPHHPLAASCSLPCLILALSSFTLGITIVDWFTK